MMNVHGEIMVMSEGIQNGKQEAGETSSDEEFVNRWGLQGLAGIVVNTEDYCAKDLIPQQGKDKRYTDKEQAKSNQKWEGR